jgi:hypothetical protein
MILKSVLSRELYNLISDATAAATDDDDDDDDDVAASCPTHTHNTPVFFTSVFVTCIFSSFILQVLLFLFLHNS